MDIISWVLANGFTSSSLEGMGALKGKNCTISSITPIENGNEVIFAYELDDGTKKEEKMKVMNGDKGISIESVTIDENKHLICTMSDGNIQDSGELPIINNEEVNNIVEEKVQKQIETQLDETIQEKVDKAIENALNGSGGSDSGEVDPEVMDEINSWF